MPKDHIGSPNFAVHSPGTPSKHGSTNGGSSVLTANSG